MHISVTKKWSSRTNYNFRHFFNIFWILLIEKYATWGFKTWANDASAVEDALLALILAHYVLGTHSHKSREIILLGGSAAGQIGFWFRVGALAVKSKRAGPGWEWAGPGRTGWGFTLRPPPCLWQTLHWIISPPETLTSPRSLRAQPSTFSMDVCSCITGCYMKICWMTNNIYQTLRSSYNFDYNFRYAKQFSASKKKKIKQNRENNSLLSQLLTQLVLVFGGCIDICFYWPVL